MICPSCSHQNPDNNRFCSRCGTTLPSGTTAQETRQLPIIPQPWQNQVPQQTQQNPMPQQAPIPQQPAPEEDDQEKKRRFNRRLLRITAIVTAIALLAGIAGWYFHFGPGSKVTVWVRTCAKYRTGDTVTSIDYYDYDEHGRLLSIKTDNGPAEQVYNQEELIYEHVYHEADGTIDSTTSYEYDNLGHPMAYHRESHYIIYSGSETIRDELVSYHYWYDWKYQKTNPDSVIVVDQNGHETSHQITVEDGNVTKIFRKDDNGNQIVLMEAEYDGKGRLISETQMDSHSLPCRYTYEYDKKGNLTKVSTFERNVYTENKDWTPSSTMTYEYDNKGNLVAVSHKDSDGRITDAEFTYDKKGNLTEMSSKEQDSISKATFTYDGKTLKKCRVSIVSAEETETYTYKYDENGNLADDGDGTYEYKQLRLSKADAENYYRQQQLLNRYDAAGGYRVYSIPFCYLIPTPVCPLYEKLPTFE